MTDCPEFHYCDGNTTYPYGKLCDNGSYGIAAETAYVNQANCTACPSTQFCTAGQIVGDCAPGYICTGSADSHTP